MIITENKFLEDSEGWCSYIFNEGYTDRERNQFMPAKWVKGGEFDRFSHIWVDQKMWSWDTLENPVSILPLVYYRSWTNHPPMCLTDTKISFRIRGEDLHLYGAKLFFWVFTPYTRWHYIFCPFVISELWENVSFKLINKESLWHCSWVKKGHNQKSLGFTLKRTTSYGFSLVGWEEGCNPKGKLCMSHFKIEK